jgi:Histone methylation protein DOT1
MASGGFLIIIFPRKRSSTMKFVFAAQGFLLSCLNAQLSAFSVNHAPSRPSKLTSYRLDATLQPEENPTADPDRLSRSGVRYASVLDGLHTLYPPTELSKRNAASRTDGYWPFINKGEEPPQQFTYGEFDFYFFAELLDRVHEYYHLGRDDADRPMSWDDKVFVDIGSGTGRLVLAAAALHPGWKLCRGIEVLRGIHAVAEETLQKCRVDMPRAPAANEEVWVPVNGVFIPPSALVEAEDKGEEEAIEEDTIPIEHYLPNPVVESIEERLKLAPVHLSCGSFEDPYEYFGDADVVFVFSSCMSTGMMQGLSKAMGLQCKPGTIIVTTEFQLPLEGTIEPNEDDPSLPSGSYKLELIESIDGFCWLTGGESTALIHRVVQSLWEEGAHERQPPLETVEEMCFRAVKYAEAQDTNKFLRDVRNEMVFNDFPEHWLPSLNSEDEK